MDEYMKRINKALANGVLDTGSLVHAFIAHDANCGIYKGKECHCDPEITIETDKGKLRVTSDGILEAA